MRSDRVGSPTRLAIILQLPGGFDLEKHLHGLWFAHLSHGEWYALTQQQQLLIPAIQQRWKENEVLYDVQRAKFQTQQQEERKRIAEEESLHSVQREKLLQELQDDIDQDSDLDSVLVALGRLVKHEK